MIAILCPTRGRPKEAMEMAESALLHARHPDNVVILLGIDDSDPCRRQYRDENRRLFWDLKPGSRNVYDGHWPNRTVSELWDVLRDVTRADILMMGNDDLLFETKGWDEILLRHVRTYPDDIYCCWFNDLINYGNHCAFPIVSRKWVETVGYFAPTCGFKFFYNDTWIYDIAKRIGRTHYIGDVTCRHRHWSQGGDDKVHDDTTRRNRDDGQLVHDTRMFDQMAHLRQEAAEKLKAVMA